MIAASLKLPMDGPSNAGIDWTQALESNRRWLATVIRARLSDQQAAEDVLQEVAVAAIRQASKPTDPAKVAPWLYRIALRKVINHHRSVGRRRRLIDGAIASGLAREKTSEAEPGEWLMRKESNKNISDMIQRLEPHDRQILLLKYSEGWGYQELAEHLGITIKTVEYRLLKARRSLRALLGSDE
jgi:RNA polymerase sigma factor (sigma-70 family)